MYVKFADCAKIVKSAFPDYSGRGDVSVDCSGRFDCVDRYWSSGCKNEYVIVGLVDGLPCAEIPGVNPLRGTADQYDCAVPAGYAVVCRKFRGQREVIEISVPPEGVVQFLPAPQPALSANQVKVLYYTRSLKSSYGGQSNYRQASSGLSAETWNSVKAELIAMGLLDKRGALTTNGKNVARGLDNPSYADESRLLA